jgi:hypothetical protein
MNPPCLSRTSRTVTVSSSGNIDLSVSIASMKFTVDIAATEEGIRTRATREGAIRRSRPRERARRPGEDRAGSSAGKSPRSTFYAREKTRDCPLWQLRTRTESRGKNRALAPRSDGRDTAVV